MENVDLSCMFFSFRGQGGVHVEGGTMRQIPYFSALGRILEI